MPDSSPPPPRLTPLSPALRGAALLVALAVVADAVLRDEVATPVAHAYIGPAAGIVLIGSFLTILTALFSTLFFIATYPARLVWRSVRSGRAVARAKTKRVVVLGLDGLEPTVTERLMDEGRLPNLAALRATGAYRRLGTSCPPLSPVAWSSFTTGSNPGKHNIFDFIARDPATYRPAQSSVRVAPPKRTLPLGSLRIPLSAPELTGLRKSKPFWNVLGESGIFSAVVRVPITFPPDRFRGVQLSAMCVPDLRGTYGTFSYFTEGEAAGATTDGDVGGDIVPVTRHGDTVRGALRGPNDPLRGDHRELSVPFTVTRRGDALTLQIDGTTIPLTLDELTPWVHVRFRTMAGLIKVRGICRFQLRSFDAPFALYCTPVQIDPGRPAMPISHPPNYAKYLSKATGDYSTLGLAEDTWALSEQRIDEDAFLRQAYDIHDERERMFFDALQRVRRGCVVCVFDAPDRIQHMFWRFTERDHPARPDADAGAHDATIEAMYERMDDLVGRTVAELDDDTALFVMSDHGFKSFQRGIDLNAWLRANGYLALKDGAPTPSRTYLADIDWAQTKAYALGLAGIFLNVRGREGHGIVDPEDAAALRREIATKLTGLTDPGRDDTVAIHEAMPRDDVFHGPYADDAPDIIVGYRSGYRVSWDAVIGKCTDHVFCDNTKAWSGDHCIHPDLVPGVLFSSRRDLRDQANIVDLAPTVLDLFGVRVPGYMDGQTLLCDDEPSSN